MAIEVRQVTVRSTVQPGEDREAAAPPRHEPERMKEEILAECRRMVLEMMRSERER